MSARHLGDLGHWLLTGDERGTLHLSLGAGWSAVRQPILIAAVLVLVNVTDLLAFQLLSWRPPSECGSAERSGPAASTDDELAKKSAFDSWDALKDELRGRMAIEKERANKQRQEQDLISVLINENTFDLPASMVEEQAEQGLRGFAERLEQNGLDKDEIEQRVNDAKEEARQDAERRVRTFFLLDAIAKKERIFVTEGDVEVELRDIAAQNNVSVNDVREHYESHKLLPDLRLGIMERKVRDFLRGHAKLTD